MDWIIWVKFAIEIMKLLQTKNKGEQLTFDEVVAVLTRLNVAEKDIKEIVSLLPDLSLLVKDIVALLKTKN